MMVRSKYSIDTTTTRTIDKSRYCKYNLGHRIIAFTMHTPQHTPQHKSENTHTSDLTAVLFQPKVLLGIVLLWVFVVAAGSSIAIFFTQQSMLSDAQVETLLSENERLALSANVAYAQEQTVAPADTETQAVYPGRLVVPRLGIDLPVSNPTTRDIAALDEELKSAVVRYPDSATLGIDGGNTLIFGHSSRLPIVRNQFFKAFNNIEDLADGEEIIVHAQNGDSYHYRVSRVYRASATDDRIPLQVAGHRLTLLTCDSFGAKSDRWVVEADYTGKNL